MCVVVNAVGVLYSSANGSGHAQPVFDNDRAIALAISVRLIVFVDSNSKAIDYESDSKLELDDMNLNIRSRLISGTPN